MSKEIHNQYTAIKYDKPTLTALCVNNKGYINVSIMWHGQCLRGFLHRLVAETAISNPENKPTVNHKDGNKMNNTVSNLEWNTYKENQDHANSTGLNRHVRAVENSLGEVFKSTQAAADAYGFNRRTVYDWCCKKRACPLGIDWRWSDV